MDLNDGCLQKQYDEYKERLAKVEKVGLVRESVCTASSTYVRMLTLVPFSSFTLLNSASLGLKSGEIINASFSPGNT